MINQTTLTTFTPQLSTLRGLERIRDYMALVKIKLSLLVLFSVMVGFWLSSGSGASPSLFFKLLLGSILIIGGANAFNEIIERNEDALMKRTAIRPLPSHRMSITEAAFIATSISLTGFLLLAMEINLLTGMLALIAFVLYVFLYTPLKKKTPWSVFVGAFPGAIPALMGGAAIFGKMTLLSWILFGIVFLWQFPHFFAIAWLARDDYAKAGFRVLPSMKDPRMTAHKILLGAWALLGVSPLLTFTAHAGFVYLGGSVLLSLILLLTATQFWFELSQTLARRTMGVALAYLPLLFILMFVDKVPSPW